MNPLVKIVGQKVDIYIVGGEEHLSGIVLFANDYIVVLNEDYKDYTTMIPWTRIVGLYSPKIEA